MPTETPEISVIIPCLNEEANVAAITAAVLLELSKVTESYEILFIDNGSSDATAPMIKEICAVNPFVRLIVNNKNYGQMRSPTHGIYQTRGRAVIGLCADFQDPPQMIGEFVQRWRNGTKIVLGVRESEKSFWLVRLGRDFGYWMLNRLGDYPLIPNATGFGLYDRAVVDCLKQWNEPEPFFRGMLVESGFSIETIPYRRPARAGGRSKNNLKTVADFALTALTCSAKAWLRAPLGFAVALFVVSTLSVMGAVAEVALGHAPWDGLMFAAAAFLFGWVFFFLGLIGDQVRLIAERTRNVPLVVEQERVNF